MTAKTSNIQLYSLCKHKETLEYHIFLARKSDDKCFFSSKTALCDAMSTEDRSTCISNCATEDEIRERAATIGDRVCGNCMKTIYKTENE